MYISDALLQQSVLWVYPGLPTDVLLFLHRLATGVVPLLHSRKRTCSCCGRRLNLPSGTFTNATFPIYPADTGSGASAAAANSCCSMPSFGLQDPGGKPVNTQPHRDQTV